jgi:hypothetical protein
MDLRIENQAIVQLVQRIAENEGMTPENVIMHALQQMASHAQPVARKQERGFDASLVADLLHISTQAAMLPKLNAEAINGLLYTANGLPR